MTTRLSRDDLWREVGAVTSRWEARALLRRASGIAGVRGHGALEQGQLLLILEALGAEGGAVQRCAESLAQRVLADKPWPD